ncbi:MAG: hypothetical protein M0Q51_07905 [Bacteroidales bacterium]|nr:hypothetical protein [Bacteroidales bacterium]
MNRKIFLLLGLSLLAVVKLSGQGLLCETSEPFCTGSIYTFPAGTTGSAEYGPYYFCLSTQPAPAWYHMLIDNPGPITIYMFSTPLVDIDFICWGPFTDPFAPCPYGLTESTVVDCSYSPYPTEYCVIPNGQTGQYYILLITNYSQDPCEITFSQTGGSGSTDCTILPPPVSNNGPLCVGETLNLYAETVPDASYWWSGPAGFLSAQQNPVIPNVTTANAGDYSCIITVNGQSSDPAISTVIIYNLPTASLLSADTTVCPGTPAYALMQFTGWGPFKVYYNDGSNNFEATNLYGPVDTIFLFPTGLTTYTFTKVEDIHCERNLIFMDLIAETYPATSGTLSGTNTICAGESAGLTFTLAGSPPWSITYTANGADPQTVAANSSPYLVTVYPTATTTYAFTYLEDINCTGQTSGQAIVTVNPSPTTNAGTDQTIAYGTTTTLNGQASGGSGDYQYSWEPADKLTNPNIQQPTTVNLTESTLFTLTTTDNVGGCYDTDDILVTITGGPLGCYPAAYPPAICAGESSQLISLASGGSGSYTFLWSSNPAGFSSTLPDPVVTPTQNTTYTVLVNDGYNVITGNATVNVHQLPVPEAGNDITIPHGTTTVLQGSATSGSGSYSYHWEPADKLVNPDIAQPHTFNLFATTLFTLYVTDLTFGCEAAAPDQMTVIISGDALAINPSVSDEDICFGESAQLFALAGGGSGTYTYSWVSSNGFSSTIQNPVITPQMPGAFIYTCTVNDGFNSVQGSVAINVRSVPFIDFGFGDTTICVYDTVVLDAGNPGSEYVWSNGSTESWILVATTGIGFDMQTHSVTVTNPSGCQLEATVNVIFDFSACNGIEGDETGKLCRIYPNPGDGTLHLVFQPGVKEAIVSASNLLGQNICGPYHFDGLDKKSEVIINIGNQPEGVYFIHIKNNVSVLYTTKYILRR